MAGAISAGAYTAGVVDYLIEALDRWEQARASGDPRVPTHRVMIDLMTGASAGGMTAAITSAALFDRTDPVNNQHGGYQGFTGYNKLYEAWVLLTADEMLPELLKTTDIPIHGAASVLNSDFVDTIAEKMLRVETPTKRDYVSSDLEICLSLSSLTGIPAIIDFGNNQPTTRHSSGREVDGQYITYNHLDYGHFIFNSVYGKGRIPVSFQDPGDEGLGILRDCAMATGAFPVGLRWRAVRRKGKYLNDSPLINPNVKRPLHNIDNEAIFSTVNVDGGMLNNEPFEVAQKLLSTKFRNRNLLCGENTGASILMIDPFPSVEDEDQIKPAPKIRLNRIIGEIYATMRSQLLFKPSDLEDGTDGRVFNRFLMAPTRTFEDRGKVIGSRAIACGSLDGFGGFITKDFRAHDFQLGRRNCQQFLRKHFVMPDPTTNPIIAAGYADPKAVDTYREKVIEADKDGHKKIVYVLPIIPDIDLTTPTGKAKDEEKPAFPVYNEVTMRDLVFKNDEAIKERLKAILEDNELLNFHRLLITILVEWLDDKASQALRDVIIRDLKDHQLIHDSPE
jgi:hypothetical protein